MTVNDHVSLWVLSSLKLVFLVDYEYCKKFGTKFTEAKYLRYFYGPYSIEIYETLRDLVNRGIVYEEEHKGENRKYFIYKPFKNTEILAEEFARKFPKAEEIARAVIKKFEKSTLVDILDHVYSLKEVEEGNKAL